MNKNDVSIKNGIPFYVAGFALIAMGSFLISADPEISLYYTFVAFGSFIADGLLLYLGWLLHMGKDMKGYDDSGGRERRIFLDKPAAQPTYTSIGVLSKK
jgi:hypothetical protein